MNKKNLYKFWRGDFSFLILIIEIYDRRMDHGLIWLLWRRMCYRILLFAPLFDIFKSTMKYKAHAVWINIFLIKIANFMVMIIRCKLCKLLKFTAIPKFHSGFSFKKKTIEEENWNRWTEFQLNFRYIVSKRTMWSGGLNRVFYSLVLCNRLIRLAKGNVISFLKSFIILMTLFDAFSVVFCVALSLCVCCISCMHIGRHKTNFLNENEYF